MVIFREECKKKITWEDLAQIDAKLTMQMFDNELVKTHKIFIEQDNGTSVALRQDLEREMRSDYLAFEETFEMRIVAQVFSKDNLEVFTKCRLTYNEFVKGLTGFLVPIPQREILPGYNDVSVFEHKSGPKLMLGGVSFVNSSCKENCVNVLNRNKIKVCIRVTAIKGIQKGEEITVNYGDEYFGPNRMFCECPHSAFHGTNPAVINSWTRSGKV